MLTILMLLADSVIDIFTISDDGKAGWDQAAGDGKGGWDEAKDSGKAGW
jgi:hypothetical protein